MSDVAGILIGYIWNLAYIKEEEKEREEKIKASYQKGIIEGIKEGRMEGNLELLDNFFNRFKNKEELQNIFLLEKVSSSLLIQRYGNSQIVKKFETF